MHYDNYNLHCVISIHALLAESDSTRQVKQICRVISIHALLAESDNSSVNTADQEARFLSTLSLRRATVILSLMGSLPLYFYPRSPCGERQPMGRAPRQGIQISIHALLAESDCLIHLKHS